jgi:hypothetical protein
MFWGRDFEIYDEPDVDVFDGPRAASTRSEEVLGAAAAPAGQAPLSPAGDGTARAAVGLSERTQAVGRFSGWLESQGLRRMALVAALVVATAGTARPHRSDAHDARLPASAGHGRHGGRDARAGAPLHAPGGALDLLRARGFLDPKVDPARKPFPPAAASGILKTRFEAL